MTKDFVWTHFSKNKKCGDVEASWQLSSPNNSPKSRQRNQFEQIQMEKDIGSLNRCLNWGVFIDRVLFCSGCLPTGLISRQLGSRCTLEKNRAKGRRKKRRRDKKEIHPGLPIKKRKPLKLGAAPVREKAIPLSRPIRFGLSRRLINLWSTLMHSLAADADRTRNQFKPGKEGINFLRCARAEWRSCQRCPRS